MKNYLPAVAGLVIGSSLLAAPGRIVKSGKCTLREGGPFDRKRAFTLVLKSRDIQVVFSLRGQNFFGRFVIGTTPKISNLSGKPKHVAYNIAFFDQNGDLVACTSSSADLGGDQKDLQTGSNLPEIPRGSLQKICSYQAVVYVTEGKKR
ncbi:MAG: hypothetical protein GXP31_16850 [Kiritimatiellaeota bacterium]|nr:hypothetical protein [Kiritimatiellota bacterium]